MIDFTGLKNIYNEQMDALLANTGLATKCLLNYGITKKDLCPNCIYDPALKKSANKYKIGGPKPFVDGRICPYCNGLGSHGLVKIEPIYLAVIWDYKYWINKPINIQNPTGFIQTICSKALLDKIKKAKDLTVIYSTVNSNPLFKLSEEPNPAGLGDNNYIICNWERTGISAITESMVTKPFVGYNSANYSGPLGNIMFDVGTNGGPSAYGTYDQNGNAEEWTGTRDGNSLPIKIKVAGGYAGSDSNSLLKGGVYGVIESGARYRGFRLATLSNSYDYENFVLVDDKYNRADTNGYGAVNYDYYIGKYEVTYDQWAEFINSMASYTTNSGLETNLDINVTDPGNYGGNPIITSDTYGLLNNSFLSRVDYIEPTGFPGNYTFTVQNEYKNKPVTNMDYLDVLRYCNWLHNNKPSGYQTVSNDGTTPNVNTTEGGAYTLNGIISLSSFISHSSSAKYRLPTIHEWYKAAFYKNDPLTMNSLCSTSDVGYWNYATQNDKLPEVKNTGTVDDIAMSFLYDTSLDTGDNIVLPLSNPVDIVVDWGDGSVSYFDEDGQKEHIYASGGEYTVKIIGNTKQINNKLAFTRDGGGLIESHQSKIKNCSSFGHINLDNLDYFFYGCSSIEDVPTTLTSGITSLRDTFAYCINFNGSGLVNWDTSNIESIQGIFRNAYDFDQAIGDWNTENITDMSYAFYNTLTFDQSLNSWNTSNVTDMSYMFVGSVFDSAISEWDVSNVTNMSYMFAFSEFSQSISGWDISSLIDMSFTFAASSYNNNITSFDTTSVENMEGTFKLNSTFNQDISSWNVSGVTNMDQMFLSASSFNQDLSSWCVPNITEEPDLFDDTAYSWVLARPVWGTCP
jgi:formylglycine-generating enzyme required for sulfatase activity